MSAPPARRECTRVALIGCSASKLATASAARDLYTSRLFQKSVAYAEATCDRWYVLSAEHGLVRPDEIIEPYDTRLGTAGSVPVGEWADQVREQLAVELRDVPRVLLVALAGQAYRTVLSPCQWPFTVPMEGLGIGQQLQYLTQSHARDQAFAHPSTGGR